MNLLNLEDEKFKTIEVFGYKFKIKAMSPKDKRRISLLRVGMQNGNPVESFTQDDFIFLENIAINDTCIEEYPKGLKEYESCENWDDIVLINEVAGEIRKHSIDFESKLKKNRSIKGGSEE